MKLQFEVKTWTQIFVQIVELSVMDVEEYISLMVPSEAVQDMKRNLFLKGFSH